MKLTERKHRRTAYGPRAQFTEHELEVIDFLCAGMSCKEIAEEVGRTKFSVQATVLSLRQYTGALSAHGFVAWCFRNKVVECEKCS